MADFTISKMQEMQKTMHEKHKEVWGGLSPEKAVQKMLWLHGELGEASDVIKKNGNEKILKDGDVRNHFIEEMCDVLMYFNDVLICYNVTEDELKTAYEKKVEKNLNRTFNRE